MTFKFNWTAAGAKLVAEAIEGYVQDRNFSEIGEENFLWDVAHQINTQLAGYKEGEHQDHDR